MKYALQVNFRLKDANEMTYVAVYIVLNENHLDHYHW